MRSKKIIFSYDGVTRCGCRAAGRLTGVSVVRRNSLLVEVEYLLPVDVLGESCGGEVG